MISPAQAKQLYLDSRPTPPVPVHHWKLEETSAGAVVDSGSSPINGTNNGALINQDGFKGKCYEFIQSTSYIDIGTSAFNASEGTVSLWCNTNITPADTQETFAFSHYNAGNRVYIDKLSSGNWSYRLGSSGHVDVGIQMQTNAWYHVALSWDGSNGYFYINGEQVHTSAYTGLVSVTTSYIGTNIQGSSTNTWSGYIRDVRVYPTVINARQVKDIYRGLA